MRCRVSPSPASSGSASNASSGHPAIHVLQPGRLRILRVAPQLPFFGRAGDRSLSCLESRCFSDAGFVTPRVAPLRYAPVRIASDAGLGLPLVPHLRLCRRWIFEFPRISHPSAVPIGRSLGRPFLRSFGIADDSFPGSPRLPNLPAPSGGLPSFPGCHTFRFCLWSNLRVAPNLLPLACRRANFQVALNLRSFDVASSLICRSPRISFLWRCRRWLLRSP
jgi:hypothetical protein